MEFGVRLCPLGVIADNLYVVVNGNNAIKKYNTSGAVVNTNSSRPTVT